MPQRAAPVPANSWDAFAALAAAALKYEGAAEAPGEVPAPAPAPTSRRPRVATKRKSAAAEPASVVNVAKRRVAERRRSLRNERMATIDYDELIRRLATLVESSPAIGEIALDDIAKLYQVRAPAALPPIRRHLGRHYCGARPGPRRSGSISWSDRLTNVLTNEGYTLSACSASATPASAATR